MAHTTNHRTLPVYLVETGLPLALPALAFLAVVLVTVLFGRPANACEPVAATSPLTVSYTVTDDPATATALGIPLTDNLDYELDHVRTGPDAELGCDALTMTRDRGPALRWYECVAPANEAPRSPIVP